MYFYTFVYHYTCIMHHFYARDISILNHSAAGGASSGGDDHQTINIEKAK